VVPHRRAGRVLAHHKEGRLVNDPRTPATHPADAAALDELRERVRREVRDAILRVLRELCAGRAPTAHNSS
jgi:hypothetical protein